MNEHRNELKDALGRGDLQLGLWMAMSAPSISVTAASVGYDWGLLDAENCPATARPRPPRSVRPLPVLQIEAPDAGLAEAAVRAGHRSILVGAVKRGKDAASIVEAARAGISPVAPQSLCILVQAGCGAAMSSLSEIAATDGVDGVVISPGDLCAYMGHQGQPERGDVMQEVEAGIDAIIAAGKVAGTVAFKSPALEAYVRRGARFIGLGGDATSHAQVARDIAAGLEPVGA